MLNVVLGPIDEHVVIDNEEDFLLLDSDTPYTGPGIYKYVKDDWEYKYSYTKLTPEQLRSLAYSVSEVLHEVLKVITFQTL